MFFKSKFAKFGYRMYPGLDGNPLKRGRIMSTTDALLLENQLCFALYSTSLAMNKTYQPLLRELGLTYPQYLALLVLWQTDHISVSTLGQHLYLDSGTLTPLLKRLELADLVRRERSEDDERRVIVNLTSAGRNLKKKASEFPKQILCAAQTSVAELRSVTKALKALRTNLLNSCETSHDHK